MGIQPSPLSHEPCPTTSATSVRRKSFSKQFLFYGAPCRRSGDTPQSPCLSLGPLRPIPPKYEFPKSRCSTKSIQPKQGFPKRWCSPKLVLPKCGFLKYQCCPQH